jgi:hypothetical protein
MGSHRTAWEDRLSELADYRKVQGTAMFLQTTRKHQAGYWVETKGRNTGCM